jgi:hypothetical protein
MRAEERQPEDGEVREMTDDRPEMVWGRPLQDLGGADQRCTSSRLRSCRMDHDLIDSILSGRRGA